MRKILLTACLVLMSAQAWAWIPDIAGPDSLTVAIADTLKSSQLVSRAGAAINIAADDTLKSTLQKAGTVAALAGGKVSFGAGDTVAKSVSVTTTTTGDSVIIYTGADSPKIVFSTNGTSRDSIYRDGTGIHISDVLRTGSHVYSGGGLYPSGQLIFYTYAPAVISHGRDYPLYLYSNVGKGYKVGLGYPDSTKGVVIDSTGFRISGSTHISGIYTGNATGWTLENTVDTNVVSGVTAASRISLTFRAATATLTAPICGRTVVDTLFISCAAADTAAVRAASVDWTIFK